jgi:hypothetical protein
MGSGLIIGGALERVPGIDITNWIDYPEMWAVPALRPRGPSDVPRAIIWHSSKGLPHDREDPPAQVLTGAGATHGPVWVRRPGD